MDSTGKRETKAALKLLNQYAESYKLLESENANLKLNIKDLQTNIKINKEIIDSFLTKQKSGKTSTVIVTKLKEENASLFSQNTILTKQINTLQSQITLLSQSISVVKEENEFAKDKIFILDQSIFKKDNIIASYAKKKRNNVDPSIIIQEPNKALVALNDELLTYKAIYEKLITYLKTTRDNILKYEEVISELQNENGRLKTQNKLQTLSANRERENLLSAIRDQSSPNSVLTDYKVKNSNKRNNSQFIRHQMLQNNNNSNIDTKIIQKLKLDEERIASKENHFENEEFAEVLKMAGINMETYFLYSRNKMYSKLIDAVEFMFKLVLDKNLSITLMETENTNLNQKNCQLNKENMELLQNAKKNKKDMSDSMINNMSQITINNLNINSLSAYEKVLEENKRRREEEQGIRYDPREDNEIPFTIESVTSSEFQQECRNGNEANYITSPNKYDEYNVQSFCSIDDKCLDVNNNPI